MIKKIFKYFLIGIIIIIVYLVAFTYLEEYSPNVAILLDKIWIILFGIGGALLTIWALFYGISYLISKRKDLISKRKERKEKLRWESTKIDKIKTASFWIGLVFLSFPLLSWFFDGCSDYFFEMIDNRSFFPFSLLFGVGCGLIMFTIFDQKWRKEESIVAVGIGILVWMYLIVNVFVGDWCGLNWCFLAIFGSAMIAVGIRNLLEE